jgi:16S rRNA (guanine966-N2)-methyltransferase
MKRPKRKADRRNRAPGGGSRTAGDAVETSRPPKNTKPRQVKLRIIGGSMRGRTVRYHGMHFTRPMKDSVRESLFNIIGPSIKGTITLDLFAGTGAVSFEALSRGASRAVMVERDRRAAEFLRSTAETLDVKKKVEVLCGNAFRIGSGLLAPADLDSPPDDTPRILFLCPPYAMWTTAAEALHSLLRQAIENLPPESLIVAETDKHDDVSVLPNAAWDHRTYGGTRLSFLRPELLCGLRS